MLTISLSDEVLRRLAKLGKHKGLTVEQMARLGINGLIGQPDESFCAAPRCNTEKNIEIYLPASFLTLCGYLPSQVRKHRAVLFA